VASRQAAEPAQALPVLTAVTPKTADATPGWSLSLFGASVLALVAGLRGRRGERTER